MMAEANPAQPDNVTKSDRMNAWAGLLHELPYIAIVILGLVGICWTSISGAPATTYWVILTPICAFICIAAGWNRDAPANERVAMIGTQILQWAAVLVSMYLIAVSDTHRLLNNDARGLMLLTLLALGVSVSGLHLRAWKLCVTGAFLAVAVPVIAWFEEAALLLLAIGAALVALGFLSWWARARVPRLAA
jgi:hypothetical protein